MDIDSAQIIAAIVAMAHSLKLQTFAEGLETHEQMKMLNHLGCHFAQGYLISRRLPEEQFLQFVRDYWAQEQRVSRPGRSARLS